MDGAGNAYLTGKTTSPTLPTTPGAFQTDRSAGQDAFVTKFNPTGSGLVYSTYLGGNDLDVGYGIAVDGSGNAYVTGFTQSTNFPTTSGAYQVAFAGGYQRRLRDRVERDRHRAALLHLSRWQRQDEGYGIAVDGSGNAYVTGYTASTNFPLQNAFQPAYGGGRRRFRGETESLTLRHGVARLLELPRRQRQMITAIGIAVDGSGNAYVTGHTISINFPTKNPFQAQKQGGKNVLGRLRDQDHGKLRPRPGLNEPEARRRLGAALYGPESKAEGPRATGSSKLSGVPPHPVDAVGASSST